MCIRIEPEEWGGIFLSFWKKFLCECDKDNTYRKYSRIILNGALMDALMRSVLPIG